MIQIALVGKFPIVVEEGIRKSIPKKLFLIHTKNESDHNYEDEAKKLKKKIEKQHKIPTSLIKVDAFDMDQVMHTILKIINDEKKRSKKFLKGSDFAINLTGGTRPMVVAGATASYLAGTKVYYVQESKKTRDSDLVKELPIPPRPMDDNLGNTTKTMSVVLTVINRLDKTTNGILLDKLRNNSKIKKMTPQKLNYHLKNLEKFGMINITRGWVTTQINKTTGEPKIDNKLNTIEITNIGKYYAEFPDLVGSLN